MKIRFFFSLLMVVGFLACAQKQELGLEVSYKKEIEASLKNAIVNAGKSCLDDEEKQKAIMK